MSAHDQLLVVIDPVARRIDGESVRIAKDVLCGGSAAKISLPESPEEFARALARRGQRRPVIVGDDRALLRAVSLLHRDRWLGDGALGHVPVGADVHLAHALGVPPGPVAAARAVLDGGVRRLDLLVDESDGVVVGDVTIPAVAPTAPAAPGPCPDAPPELPAHGPAPLDPPPAAVPVAAGGLRHAYRTLLRGLVRAPARQPSAPRPHRLRVEADGALLCDLDQEVDAVTLRTLHPHAPGRAEVTVHPRVPGPPLTATATTITVSGPDFRYRADTQPTGPVRTRTWVVRAGAWGLTLP
ncbi:diacylglycerol kinase [Streptomyces sp. NPDC017979]|uniref:diacylglycerol kinase n=1 Tax=Streptomyces sp. NPDC017979 TaxID=3365024 RepID=UPI003789E445